MVPAPFIRRNCTLRFEIAARSVSAKWARRIARWSGRRISGPPGESISRMLVLRAPCSRRIFNDYPINPLPMNQCILSGPLTGKSHRLPPLYLEHTPAAGILFLSFFETNAEGLRYRIEQVTGKSPPRVPTMQRFIYIRSSRDYGTMRLFSRQNLWSGLSLVQFSKWASRQLGR